MWAAGINTPDAAWVHYVNHGADEALAGEASRAPSPWFDIQHYLDNNPDLRAADLSPADLFVHFITYGIDEGRAPSAPAAAAVNDASLLAYALGNADLLAAFGISPDATTLSDAQRDALANHFYRYGYQEDRPDAPYDPYAPPAEDDAPPIRDFTLTTDTDIIVGTAGDDTIMAVEAIDAGGTRLATLTAGDQIDGGAGTDTIHLIGNANGAAFAGAAVTAVEIVKAQLAGAGALDVSGNADVQQVWLTHGTTGNNIVALTPDQTAGLEGKVGTTALDVTAFSFSDATAAIDDAAVLALHDATATGVTMDHIEFLTVQAVGVNVLGTLGTATATAADTLTRLTVEGTGSVNATVTSAVLRTVDTSASTGNQALVLAASAAEDQTLKTGAGNDMMTTTWAGLTAADQIDLGAGRDTLAFTDAVSLTTVTEAANLVDRVSGVEALRVNGASTFAVDASLVSQDEFIMNSTGVFTGTNFEDTDSLTVSGVKLDASTVAMAAGHTIFNLNLIGNASEFPSLQSRIITLTGAEEINLHSTPGSVTHPEDITLAQMTTDSGSVINLTGDYALLAWLSVPATTTTGPGLTINGSSFTGPLTIIGSTLDDVITGSAGNDTLYSTQGSDSLTGDAGHDLFVITMATAGVGLDNITTIQDFTVDDAIQLSGSTAATTPTKVDLSGLASSATHAEVFSALAAANTDSITDVLWGTFNDQTYLLSDAYQSHLSKTSTPGVIDEHDSQVILSGTHDLSDATISAEYTLTL
ncbi:hypothetical protein ACMHYJ_10560 [Castellaniella hirudinis]|uniref:hypothetical protein n=1 Tax=Castellaniella hirudinis TaxID=1144617 RepID=UPI0039C3BEA7